MTGCMNPQIRAVEEFRAAREAGNLDKAGEYLGDDPRVWYDTHEGEGNAWNINGGQYKNWDEHFNGQGKVGKWQSEGNRVWAVVEEMNDYYRLIERQDMPRYRITYFFEDDGRIEGCMISAADPDVVDSPMVSQFDEFKAWATAHDPVEWEYLRPGGSLDPTGDRAARTRALANRWRVSEGLPALE